MCPSEDSREPPLSSPSPLMRLDLRAALEYEKTPLDPFASPELFASPPSAGEPPLSSPPPAEELLFCFELDPEHAGRIDPQADHFLGELVFSGRQKDGAGNVRLAAGLYLFAQRRAALSREDCIGMAIEQQKDGLWERLRLGNRLYIRRLFEDGSPVTQIFRPYNQ